MSHKKIHLFLLLCCLLASVLSKELVIPDKAKESYLRISSALKGQFESCSLSALVQIVEGECDNLDEEQRTRLAVQFANCHLQKSGIPTSSCTPSTPLRECLEPLKASNIAFNSYTEFTTHVETLCYHAQANLHHHRTLEALQRMSTIGEDIHSIVEDSSGTINQLVDSGATLASTLDELSTKQQLRFDETDSKLSALAKASQDMHATVQSVHTLSESALAFQRTSHSETIQHVLDVQSSTTQVKNSVQMALGTLTDIQRAQSEVGKGLNELSERQKSVLDRVGEVKRGQEDLLNLQTQISQVQKEQVQALESLDVKATSASERLDQSLLNQGELLAIQDAASKSLKELHANQRVAFEDASRSLDRLLKTTQETTNAFRGQQKEFRDSYNSLADLLATISNLQGRLMGEFFDLKSFLYYLFAVLLGFLFTATRRTSGARVFLFLIFSLSFFLERSIAQNAQFSLDYQSAKDQIILLRKITVAVSLICLLASTFLYRDVDRAILREVQSISERTDKLMKSTSSFRASQSSPRYGIALSGPPSGRKSYLHNKLAKKGWTLVPPVTIGSLQFGDEDGEEQDTSFVPPSFVGAQEEQYEEEEVLSEETESEQEDLTNEVEALQEDSETFTEPQNAGSGYNLRPRTRKH